MFSKAYKDVLPPSITFFPYKSRLRYLDIYSLYCRWQRGDLIETYKLLHNYYNITPNILFTFSHEERTRGHSIKLFYPIVNYSTRHNFFTIRIINLWNNLPESIISVDSVSLFKKKLDDHWNQLRYGHNQRLRVY